MAFQTMFKHQRISIRGENVGIHHNIPIIIHYNSPDSYFRDLAKNQQYQFCSFEMIDITSQYIFDDHQNDMNETNERNQQNEKNEKHVNRSNNE